MTDLYNILKKQLEEAISNNWQGRAVSTINSAFYMAQTKRITRQQALELSTIYNDWEKSWAEE